MQDKELIEQLQPHNLSHMADGSFNITEAQHAAILSLLSQQEVEDEQLLKDEFEQAEKRGGIDYATGYVEGLKDGLQQQLSQQQQQREWISVEDRLPEIGEYVLVNVGVDTVLKGRLMNNGWTAFFADGDKLVGTIRSVSHWQPLPPPPTNHK